MLCTLCQRELSASLTGALLKWTCEQCVVYYVETVDESATVEDLANIVHQIVAREGSSHGGGS